MRRPRSVNWVQPPKQGRSQRTLEALLDAAQALLETRPFHRLTVSQVVKRARSSAGSFYARFADKQALLHALHERMLARARRNATRRFAEESWQSASVGDIVQAYVMSHIALHRLNRGVLRAALMESLRDPRFAERALALGDDVGEILARLLRARSGQAELKDLKAKVAFAMRLVTAVLDQRLFLEGARATQDELNDTELAARLKAVLMACLELPESVR